MRPHRVAARRGLATCDLYLLAVSEDALRLRIAATSLSRAFTRATAALRSLARSSGELALASATDGGGGGRRGRVVCGGEFAVWSMGELGPVLVSASVLASAVLSSYEVDSLANTSALPNAALPPCTPSFSSTSEAETDVVLHRLRNGMWW